MDFSVCILARNASELLGDTLRSIAAFEDVGIEVVLGDNSSEAEHSKSFRDAADVYVEVPDEDLWFEGFGHCKSKLIRAASNDWVIVADLGEVFIENRFEHLGGLGLVGARREHPEVRCWRAFRDLSAPVQEVIDGVRDLKTLDCDFGRIFDRRAYRYLGLIHEAPFRKRTGKAWSFEARQHAPVALVGHLEPGNDTYHHRKIVLYEHLLHMAAEDPAKAGGIDPHWIFVHWEHEVKPIFKEVSFDEWREMEG